MLLSKSEYRNMGFLIERDDEIIETYLARAEELIISIISEEGEFSPPHLLAIKKAIAFQTEFYVINGVEESGEAVRVSIGDFSYTGGSKSEVSQMSLLILKKAGLFYRGCEVK